MALTTFIPSPLLAGSSFFLLGAGPILWVISTTTLRQSVTPPRLLGRVSAINIMSYGARPLGAGLGAVVGGLYGAETCLYLAVAIFAVAGVGDPDVARGLAGAAAGDGERGREGLRPSVRQIPLVGPRHRFVRLSSRDRACRDPARGRCRAAHTGRWRPDSPPGRIETAAKSDDASNSRSTERHIDAMRLTSLTAGPTTVKSSRSSLPILP